MNNTSQWNSTLTFILAMIGLTIGIGNIWRFSYVLYSNGGGSFFIPYTIAILVMGVPFLILEYGLGFSFLYKLCRRKFRPIIIHNNNIAYINLYIDIMGSILGNIH